MHSNANAITEYKSAVASDSEKPVISDAAENHSLAAASRSRQSANDVWAIATIGAHTAAHKLTHAISATACCEDLFETKTRAHTEFMMRHVRTLRLSQRVVDGPCAIEPVAAIQRYRAHIGRNNGQERICAFQLGAT